MNIFTRITRTAINLGTSLAGGELMAQTVGTFYFNGITTSSTTATIPLITTINLLNTFK